MRDAIDRIWLIGVETCRPPGLDWRDVAAGTAKIIRQREVGDARRNFGTETRSVEYTIMADAGLLPMRFERVGKVLKQLMRRLGLAKP